jgi:hypothetical protein
LAGLAIIGGRGGFFHRLGIYRTVYRNVPGLQAVFGVG